MWKPGSLFDESIEHGNWYDDGLFSDELYHHGIKGQKWGVRRTPEQLGRVKAALKPGHERRMNYYKTRNAAAILAGQASKVVVGPLVKAKYSKRY